MTQRKSTRLKKKHKADFHIFCLRKRHAPLSTGQIFTDLHTSKTDKYNKGREHPAT